MGESAFQGRRGPTVAPKDRLSFATLECVLIYLAPTYACGTASAEHRLMLCRLHRAGEEVRHNHVE